MRNIQKIINFMAINGKDSLMIHTMESIPGRGNWIVAQKIKDEWNLTILNPMGTTEQLMGKVSTENYIKLWRELWIKEVVTKGTKLKKERELRKRLNKLIEKYNKPNNKIMKAATSEDIEEFKSYFIPWGSMDVGTAIETYRKAGKTDMELVDAIESYINETGVKLDTVDVCYVAYDTLHQEARTDIEEATGKDILNDDPYSDVVVYGNFLCTAFDGKDEAMEATKKLIDTMEEKSEVVLWYYNQLN
jgi:predicted DNA-binding protein